MEVQSGVLVWSSASNYMPLLISFVILGLLKGHLKPQRLPAATLRGCSGPLWRVSETPKGPISHRWLDVIYKLNNKVSGTFFSFF